MHAPRCHPRWSLLKDPHSARIGQVEQADTPLLITVETPLAPTQPWSSDLLPFGPRLLDPFGAHTTLGFHHSPARLAALPGAYSFRSSPFHFFNWADSSNRRPECQADKPQNRARDNVP